MLHKPITDKRLAEIIVLSAEEYQARYTRGRQYRDLMAAIQRVLQLEQARAEQIRAGRVMNQHLPISDGPPIDEVL